MKENIISESEPTTRETGRESIIMQMAKFTLENIKIIRSTVSRNAIAKD